MKKIIAALTAAVLAACCTACGKQSDSNSKSTNSGSDDVSQSQTQEFSETVQVEAVHKESDSMFSKYPSNTVVATGNNGMVNKVDSVTYRAYFPVEKYGDLEYCFYFSNAIDSTYNNGKPVHVGAETADYTIESARIADGGTSDTDEITGYTEVTFGGETSTTVKSGESLWSDPIDFTLEEGHYLVWEWTVSGEKMPATYMSNLTSATSSEDGEEFGYCDRIPLPQLIGAARETKYNIAAIGDSITQGCMTDYMAYESWAMQISEKLGDEYSLWNCGLGWARSSDAATDGDWLERTKNADIAIVAFGTNDISSGEYGGDGGNTAEEIDEYIRTIIGVLKDADCTVIVFNSPPQDYEGENEATRTEYNEKLKETCSELGVYYFDFASYLCDEDTPAAAKYGGHPTGEAGGIVSDAFIEKFATILGTE